MSPGPSTQSWVTVNSRSSLSSTSSRKPSGGATPFKARPASICQRRWPCACSRNTSYWSTCAPTEPPGAAKDTITSSMRQRGRKSKRSSSAPTSASHLSTSCTSRVQSWCGIDGNMSSGNGPWRSIHLSPSGSCATMRASTPSSQASPARSSGCSGDSKPGKALRISSGFFCQYSRRNCSGGMPSMCFAEAWTSIMALALRVPSPAAHRALRCRFPHRPCRRRHRPAVAWRPGAGVATTHSRPGAA